MSVLESEPVGALGPPTLNPLNAIIEGRNQSASEPRPARKQTARAVDPGPVEKGHESNCVMTAR